MRTKKIKIHRFSELKKSVREKVMEEYLELEHETFDWIIQDAHNSFEKFANIFSVENYRIDYCETYRNEYKINLEDDIKQLSGIRLCGYIWNNYRKQLFKGKYYSVESGKVIHHNRVKSTKLSNGKIFNAYYSAIELDNSCVLTGVCYDQDLLDPIYKFLEKPSNTTFEELINECIESLCKSVRDEIEGNSKEEAIAEYFDANDHEFLADGREY